jgi:hypothetical protein
LFDRSTKVLATYALAALLAVTELVVLWQTLHPNVSDDYRAYYITRTTTCLPQPVTASYVLGQTVDFTNKGDRDAARELLPCGWEGPNDDGRQSLGETSRLRFAVGPQQDLRLELVLKGIDLNDAGDRDIRLFAGEQPIGQVLLGAEATQTFQFGVPAAAIRDGYLDLRLDFPNAIETSPGISNTYWRSVKLISARLSPA